MAQIKLNAERGNAESQFDLGKIYSREESPGADIVEAYKWVSLAFAQDFPGAKDLRSTLGRKMTQPQIEEAQKRALEFIPSVSRTPVLLSVEAKRERLRKLMSLAGSEEQMKAMFTQLMAQLRSAFPQISDKEFHDLVELLDYSELREIIVSIYEQHFTPDEIQQLVEFYQTPLGKRLLAESLTISSGVKCCS